MKILKSCLLISIFLFSCKEDKTKIELISNKAVTYFNNNILRFNQVIDDLDRDSSLMNEYGSILSYDNISKSKSVLKSLKLDSVYIFTGGCNMHKKENQYDLYCSFLDDRIVHYTRNRCDSITTKKGYFETVKGITFIGLGDYWTLWFKEDSSTPDL